MIQADTGSTQIEYEEYTHYGLAARLAAGARDLPFMPVNTFVGSDLPKYNDNLRIVESPFDGDEIYAVPPLNPDVTIVHGARADEDGNAQGWGIIGEVRDAVFAADTVVLSVEEIVDKDVIRSDPNRTVFPGTAVDYLVEEPFGAHPSYVHGYYGRDRTMYQQWNELSSERARIEEWLDEWVYGVENRVEYLEKLGVERLLDLEPETKYTSPVNMGDYQ
jgi:glutaconate CoA-transferase subunit A